MIALAAPVAVPVSTSRAPAVVVITLAVTPGLLGAALMAEAMPDRVSLLESMVIEVEALPTASVERTGADRRVSPLATGAEVSVAAVARFCTSSEYWPGAASELVLAEAMVLSATVAS